jgi:hypothetical protein
MDGEVIAAGAVALWYFLRNRGKKAAVEAADETVVTAQAPAAPVTVSVPLPLRAEPVLPPPPPTVAMKIAITEKPVAPPAPTLTPAPEVVAPQPVEKRTHSFQRKQFQPRGNLYDAGDRTWPPALPTFLK